ncbi:MAG: hypothetical protein PHV51_06185 [Methanosarcinaceae archaeon]|nr:hypothetical protein [Methanosarcinaceae archaeon]MDD4497722.1 hypothetical protein [Methanosarcinaceae archaeon]
MSLKNMNTITLVLLCALAVIFGIVGGGVLFNYSNEGMLVGNVEELTFSENLLNNEMKVIIEEINASYPGSVEWGDGKIILIGYKAIDEFDSLSFENGMEMTWEFVPVPAGDAIFIQDADYLLSETCIYSSQDDVLPISYEELDKLLKGDEATVEMFRDILYDSGWNESE